MPSAAEEEGKAIGTAEYWDKCYAVSNGEQPTHEWLQSFASLEPFFQAHLFSVADHSAKILHLGSGDSTIPYDLAKLGYRNQLCVDFSPTVVALMSARNEPGIEWQQADVRNMTNIEAGSVDVGFDKGTLDAMIYGSPWDPPDEVKDNTGKYVDEVFRVLKNDGVFLCISFRQPYLVKPLLNRKDDRNLECEMLRGGQTSFDYHAFILRKA